MVDCLTVWSNESEARIAFNKGRTRYGFEDVSWLKLHYFSTTSNKTPVYYILIFCLLIMCHTTIIYTDGSCDTGSRTGAWVAIVISRDGRVILSGVESDTTHQRMELSAVIVAIDYVQANYSQIGQIHIVTDSQYVTGLPARSEKLTGNALHTRRGDSIVNADLVQKLLTQLAGTAISFQQVKAHKKTHTIENFNREADMLSRKLVREAIKIKNGA